LRASPASHRYTALDSLRGIAALGVALHHIEAVNGPARWSLFGNGGLFVDFFFVLSGFVIAASYGERLAQGFSLLRYTVLRIGRVWPLHAVMVLAALALELAAWLFGSQGLSAYAPFTGTHSLGHALTSFLLLDGFFPGRTNFYSGAGWSISVELLLYALAALAFRGGRWGMAALMGAGVLGLGLHLAGLDLPGLTTMVQRGLAGFALGTACWFIHGRLAPFRLGGASLIEGLAIAALFLAIALADSTADAALVIVPAALVVLVFAREQGAFSQVLQTATFGWLGRISYAIYMVHAMVQARIMDLLLLASRGMERPMAEYDLTGAVPVKRMVLDPLEATLVQAAMIAVVLVVAQFAWRWIEEPARQWSRRYSAAL
jgi:peptidoglycan/LPS O-acetylase OafA/YrhL